MLCLNVKLDEDYALDIAGFYKVREFSDGVTWINVHMTTDLYRGDHNPRFSIEIIFVNYMLFTFEVYNTHHTNEE